MYAAVLRFFTRPWFFHFMRSTYGFFVSLIWGVKVYDRDKIPLEGGIVLAANHTTTFDPPTIGSKLPRSVSFMAKKELFSTKFLNLVFRGIRAFPVDRQRNDVSAVKEALRRLKNDDMVGVFIEGTRTRGAVAALDGASYLAQRAGVPILPVAIWRVGRSFHIRFGDPFEVDGKGRAAMQEATATTVRRINEMLPESYALMAPAREEAETGSSPKPAADDGPSTAADETTPD